MYFNRKTRDVVIYGPAFTYINLDEQHDQGIEIEPSFKISKDLEVKAYYAYVTGKVRSQSNGKDTGYNNLIRKPRHSFGLNIGYQVTKQLYVSTNLYAYGKRDDLFFNLSDFTQQPVILKAYALWNAYAEYGFVKNRLRVFADLRNLTDAKYYEIYGYSAQGFNFSAGVALRL